MSQLQVRSRFWLSRAATTFDTAAWLIYPSRTYLPGKVRAAVDYLKEALG